MKSSSTDDFVMKELARLRTDLEANQERLMATQRRLKATWAVCFAILLGGIGLAASPTGQAQFGITLASLNTSLMAVETKTAPLAYNSTTKLLTVSGANVMIIDGTGATESTSGLGNLQVGYNGTRGGGDIRTGSHNLILGDSNNYSSSGGMVVGFGNETKGLYATISGGTGNLASGPAASVSGGKSNSASGIFATVSGGSVNIASGESSTVSAGSFHSASGKFTAVCGGDSKQAKVIYSSVSGGRFNIANGNFSTVCGGLQNTANGTGTAILGANLITLGTDFTTYPAGP